MSREEELRSINSRRRNLLYLIEKFLLENGLETTAQALRTEARLIPDYEICDNVDLDSIYLEYASYYQVKFGKYPKILKKAPKPVKVSITTPNRKTQKKDETSSVSNNEGAGDRTILLEENLKISQIFPEGSSKAGDGLGRGMSLDFEMMTIAPELKELSEVIGRSIIRKTYNLTWSDVCGNSNAVKVLQEAVVTPLKFPQMFSSEVKPWKSVLLHGPSGSGKTLLAKVLCSETFGSVTFFNITSSIVTSKWRGESEKIIKVLFDMARSCVPSIVFIDEIEGLTSNREKSSDHEASKRFKNEFLQQLDGMDESSGVFVLANTNLPWDIDVAFLRRFEKKILVELPNFEERQILILKFLKDAATWPKAEIENISNKCEGFTGDELRIACKEFSMTQIRAMTASMPTQQRTPLTSTDFVHILERIKPTSAKEMQKFVDWNSKYELL